MHRIVISSSMNFRRLCRNVTTIPMVVKSSEAIAFRCNRINHHRLVRASVAQRILQQLQISHQHSNDHNTISNNSDLVLVSFDKKKSQKKQSNIHENFTIKKSHSRNRVVVVSFLKKRREDN